MSLNSISRRPVPVARPHVVFVVFSCVSGTTNQQQTHMKTPQINSSSCADTSSSTPKSWPSPIAFHSFSISYKLAGLSNQPFNPDIIAKPKPDKQWKLPPYCFSTSLQYCPSEGTHQTILMSCNIPLCGDIHHRASLPFGTKCTRSSHHLRHYPGSTRSRKTGTKHKAIDNFHRPSRTEESRACQHLPSNCSFTYIP